LRRIIYIYILYNARANVGLLLTSLSLAGESC